MSHFLTNNKMLMRYPGRIQNYKPYIEHYEFFDDRRILEFLSNQQLLKQTA